MSIMTVIFLSVHKDRFLIAKQSWFCVNLLSDLSVFSRESKVAAKLVKKNMKGPL